MTVRDKRPQQMQDANRHGCGTSHTSGLRGLDERLQEQAIPLDSEPRGELRVVAVALAVQLPVVLLVDKQLEGLLRVAVIP